MAAIVLTRIGMTRSDGDDDEPQEEEVGVFTWYEPSFN